MRLPGRDPDLELGESSAGLGRGQKVVGPGIPAARPIIGQEPGTTLRLPGSQALHFGVVVDGRLWQRSGHQIPLSAFCLL